ncbi:MAG: hypothetical protein K0R14_1797 [Burkholderiales bacterium]|jgi:hypothetical protein|nr:hypothetical protein [Burkholderiales bacterium]
MKLKSLIKKSYYRFYKYLIIGKNKQCFFKGQQKNLKQVIFYLADAKIVHLGDSLWFEPIARFLADHFDVAIYPNLAMEFYFNNLGFKIAKPDDISQPAIIVAPIELMFKLRHLKNVLFLSFDYRSIPQGGKLINSMIKAIAHEFGLNSSMSDGRYRALSFTPEQIDDKFKQFNLQHGEKYVIFNNYIDSWGKHTTQEKVNECAKRLISYAKEYKARNMGVKFIHTGSLKDKENDPALFGGLIDIDLRGKTSIEDLFMLVSIPEIILYIGFDTFLLHLFNMYNKPRRVLLRPGQLDGVDQIVTDAVLKPYISFGSNDLELIKHA